MEQKSSVQSKSYTSEDVIEQVARICCIFGDLLLGNHRRIRVYSALIIIHNNNKYNFSTGKSCRNWNNRRCKLVDKESLIDSPELKANILHLIKEDPVFAKSIYDLVLEHIRTERGQPAECPCSKTNPLIDIRFKQ